MHIRRQFLEDLRAQLQQLPVAGVWIRRIGPPRNQFPCITLYSEQETVETETIHMSPRPQDRTLIITVQGWVYGTVDDERAELDLDAMAEKIETQLFNPSSPQQLCDDLALIATDFAVDEDEPQIHTVRLTYRISYQTEERQITTN